MRRTLASFLIAASLATAVHAQAGAPAGAAANREQMQESLLRADMAWSDTTAKGGMLGGFVSRLADDAVYLHPGADVIRGRDRIRDFLAEQHGGDTEMRWTPLRSAVSRDGTGGYTTGVLVASWMGADGQPVTRFGRYISYWRHGADGAWHPQAVMHARSVRSQAPAGSPASPAAAARGSAASAMEQADRAFAAMAAAQGAQRAFVAYAAPDVVNVGQQIVAGPAEVAASFDGDHARWAWGPVASGASDDGDLGFTVGEATIAGVGPQGSDTAYSKYLTIWQRQPDGSYRFVTDGGNGRPARP